MVRPSSLIMSLRRKRDFFSLGSVKRREGVFLASAKNGTYDNFTLHKEIYYIMRHIGCNCLLHTK
jgi:hypothetical protein